MLTAVVINDFGNQTRHSVSLNKTHFDIMEGVWNDEDRLFVEMQDNDFFTGRRRWCDLTPTHFRLMICRNLTVAADLTQSDRNDPKNPVVRSLHLLITALALCLQKRLDGLVEIIRIGRLSEMEVTFDFHGSLTTTIDPQKSSGGLRVVVDNE